MSSKYSSILVFFHNFVFISLSRLLHTSSTLRFPFFSPRLPPSLPPCTSTSCVRLAPYSLPDPSDPLRPTPLPPPPSAASPNGDLREQLDRLTGLLAPWIPVSQWLLVTNIFSEYVCLPPRPLVKVWERCAKFILAYHVVCACVVVFVRVLERICLLASKLRCLPEGVCALRLCVHFLAGVFGLVLCVKVGRYPASCCLGPPRPRESSRRPSTTP